MEHITIITLIAFLLLTGCDQDQLNDKGAKQPDTCINGVAYFKAYKGYSLYIDETTLQPVRCSTIK